MGELISRNPGASGHKTIPPVSQGQCLCRGDCVISFLYICRTEELKQFDLLYADVKDQQGKKNVCGYINEGLLSR